MIRINLLPPEFRVKERTPLPMLLGILGGVVLCTMILLVFLYCHMVWLPKVVNDLKEKQFEKQNRELKVREYNDLMNEQKTFESLDKMVKTAEENKEHWAVFLKDIVTILNEAEKTNEQLKAWVSDLDFTGPQQTRGRAKGPAIGGTISYKCDIAGSNIGLFSDFLDEVRSEKDNRILPLRIAKIRPPNLSITDHPDYNPDKSVSFNFEVSLSTKKDYAKLIKERELAKKKAKAARKKTKAANKAKKKD
jgi:hypothetical protein